MRACASSTCQDSDIHPHSHQGGEPPRGLRLEAKEEEEPQAPNQQWPGQHRSQHSWHGQLLLQPPDLLHRPQTCL